MIIETVFEQGSEEWLAARRLSIGGTGIEKIITSKGMPSKSRGKYLYEKAGQRITGKSKSIFTTYEMQWGHDYEPEARELFSLIDGSEVEQCAMIFSDEKRNWHVSPDGILKGLNKGLEIKCPQLEAHDKYCNDAKLPTKYILQIQTSLALTGFESWFFMSYYPGGVTPFIIEVPRDESLIKTIKIEVRLFQNDLDKLITKLKN